MVSKDILVSGLGNMRAKSAALFVYESSQFICDVEIEVEDRTVDGKSLLGVLTQMIKPGDTIILRCSGIDEKKALERLSVFLTHLEE